MSTLFWDKPRIKLNKSNYCNALQKTECPAETKVLTAVSWCIEGDNVTFLLQDGSIYTVPVDLVEMAFPDLERDDIEGHILTLCNPTVHKQRKPDHQPHSHVILNN